MDNKDLSNVKVTDSAGKLAKNFLYNPLTAVLAIFLLAIGYLSLEVMPREEDPQIAISGGSIIVPAPGLTPKEIEKIIVEPLEQKLREIKGVEHIYSMSANNVGIVNVMYYIGQNREISNLKLYDKIMQNMDNMPKEIMQPIVKPLDIDIDIPIMSVAFYQHNKNISYSKFLQTIEDLKKEISTIDNVSKTTLKGDLKKQYNIEVDLGKLKAYHLSLGQIVQGIKAISLKVPDVKAQTPDNKLIVFGLKNAIEDIKDVRYATNGCQDTVVIGSMFTQMIKDNDIEYANTAIQKMHDRLGEMTPKQKICAEIVFSAFLASLKNLQNLQNGQDEELHLFKMKESCEIDE
jgi:multidrug efflux pump subunit AcrB